MFPVDAGLDPESLRRHTFKVAETLPIRRKRYTATLCIFAPAFRGLFVSPVPGMSSLARLWRMAAFLSQDPR